MFVWKSHALPWLVRLLGLVCSPLPCAAALLCKPVWITTGGKTLPKLCYGVVNSWTVLSIRQGAEEIAARARGTPRIANNLIHFARDYAEQRSDGTINRNLHPKLLELLEIDDRGLDEMDKRILSTMAENYKGGPVGLGTVAVAVNEEEHTLEEVHEPFLIQEGYLKRTQQGRVLTPKGWEASGVVPGAGSEGSQLSLM